MLIKSPKDIVFLSALRTPITKAKKGYLSSLYPEQFLAQLLRATLSTTSIDASKVDDVLIGTVLQSLGGQKACAIAVKEANFPNTTTVATINRQCASSAQALTSMAYSLLCGENRVAIAAGVESMTRDYFPHRGIPQGIYPEFSKSGSCESQKVVIPMGVTSENVSLKFGISRRDQDLFALASQRKAFRAQKEGHFAKEIAPIESYYFDERGKKIIVTVTKDDGIREGVTIEKLSALSPAFSSEGTTTAGNSSQISDGASALLLTTRENSERLGIKPIAKFVGSTVAGVEPDLMGIGPSVAIPKLLARFGLKIEDIDIFELNEAFASQSIYCIDKLGINYDKVNPFGGAIALGHPLGATGARVVTTLINGLKTKDREAGVVSMCTSTGQGYAGLILNE